MKAAREALTLLRAPSRDGGGGLGDETGGPKRIKAATRAALGLAAGAWQRGGRT